MDHPINQGVRNEIVMREIERKDLSVILRWRQDKNLYDQLGGPFRYSGTEAEEQWFNNYFQNRGNQIRLGIWHIHDDCMIGVVYLTQIDWVNRSAEFAMMVGETKYQGKGYGYEAAAGLINHAFGQLNLRRIQLTVIEYNRRAISLYHKLGFQIEGTMREGLFKNNEYHNVILMSLLSSEWIH